MNTRADIPTFTLFGETAQFPDILHIERISERAPAHGWHISAHRHAHMAQLFVLERGHLLGQVDARQIELEGGAFLFVPAQIVHEFTFESGSEGLVISMPLAVPGQEGPLAADLARALARPVSGEVTQATSQLAQMLTEARTGGGRFRAQQILGLVQALLAEVAQQGARQGADTRDARLSHLDRLVRLHLAEGWRVADYAAALGISTGHLSRLSRAASGLGAAAYIEHAVMQEACRLLAFTQLPVSAVGYRLGFDDPSYFSKRFRTLRGQAPSSYRAQFNG